MMSRLGLGTFIRRAVRHQLANGARVVRGLPLTVPSLQSMTIGKDDVLLARKWLADESQWHDETQINRFEASFASWNGSAHAFSFLSGRVALSACVEALSLRPGDQVVVPGYTCVVVANAFRFAGIELVYADIELDTYGLDASRLEKKIASRTRAVVLHHLYGIVCRDYEQVIAMARNHGLAVIEDCAHATGARFRGRRVGNLGDVAVYSSEKSKVFSTIQGGIAVTNDDRIAERLRDYQSRAPFPPEAVTERQLRNVLLEYYEQRHPGRWWLGDVATALYGRHRLISTLPEEELGIRPATYGWRMPPPIAALGLNQLLKIDQFNVQRRATAKRWDDWCRSRGYGRPLIVTGSEPVFLRYPVLVEPERKRDASWAKAELGVRLGVWFVSHLHPARDRIENCPSADRAVAGCVNFPCILG
jgi:perosamine synthetase